MDSAGPPPGLVATLVHGPSVLSGLEWHDEVGSTNALAAEAAARDVAEVYAILADVQTAGRGRRGRSWTAPAGTSLLMSLITRPTVERGALGLLPLLTGLALAEAVALRCPAAQVALKWPNDLLLGGAKAAGVLVEALSGACVAGVGVNVDWRGVARPEPLAGATSLAESGCVIDRWELFATFVDVFGSRYRGWNRDPTEFLLDYRRRCTTIGQSVRVGGGASITGVATDVGADGALEVLGSDGRSVRLVAGDVEHVRPA
jgi:BirA family transcriptional regulator, biotin operon repressor / biotin---[acetyl-CoA-carboxylase] ligase